MCLPDFESEAVSHSIITEAKDVSPNTEPRDEHAAEDDSGISTFIYPYGIFYNRKRAWRQFSFPGWKATIFLS